ncbi:unnamed protein product [Pleuronectes platessa]|uniref:Uncharacterized protein n=1 Tax=Pleuronectes platessa TaxID=8262 RepID=A0A9N7VX29_PLEPL|nr:unnamed protein product [Pleuronectes platessa]
MVVIMCQYNVRNTCVQWLRGSVAQWPNGSVAQWSSGPAVVLGVRAPVCVDLARLRSLAEAASERLLLGAPANQSRSAAVQVVSGLEKHDIMPSSSLPVKTTRETSTSHYSDSPPPPDRLQRDSTPPRPRDSHLERGGGASLRLSVRRCMRLSGGMAEGEAAVSVVEWDSGAVMGV